MERPATRQRTKSKAAPVPVPEVEEEEDEGTEDRDSVERVFKERFDLKREDFSSSLEALGLKEDVFPFGDGFDLEDVWKKHFSVEVKHDFKGMLEEKSLKEEHGYYDIKPEDAMEELVNGEECMEQLEYPPDTEMKGYLEDMYPALKLKKKVEGAPAVKKLKVDTPPKVAKASNSGGESSDTPKKKLTSEEKVIEPRKIEKEKLPEDFEKPNVEEKVGKVPEEMATLSSTGTSKVPTRRLSNSSSGSGSSQKSTPRHRSISPVLEKIPSPPNSSSSTSEKKSSTGPTSLTDLMTAEKRKKAQMEMPSPSASLSSATRIKLTQRNIDTDNDACVPDLEISPVEKPKKSPTPSIAIVQPTQKIFLPSRSPQTNSSVAIPSTTSANSGLTISLASTAASSTERKILALFKCKDCSETYLCYEDNLFRKHVFMKHGIEMADNKLFEESRVVAPMGKLRECLKCKTFVQKLEDHRSKCGDTMYSFVPATPFKLLKHECGICTHPQAFYARYELKEHIDKDHANVSGRIILDPSFLCAQCLQHFNSALDLTKHCLVCTDRSPKPERILELAKSYLACDLCETTHRTAGETSSCHFKEKILRCALCLTVSKSNVNFYKHLQAYHGLITEPKLTLSCPFCTTVRGRYRDVFPHIVTDHFQKSLDEHGPMVMSVVGNYKLPPMKPLPDLQPRPQLIGIIKPPPQIISRVNPSTKPMIVMAPTTTTLTSATVLACETGDGRGKQIVITRAGTNTSTTRSIQSPPPTRPPLPYLQPATPTIAKVVGSAPIATQNSGVIRPATFQGIPVPTTAAHRSSSVTSNATNPPIRTPAQLKFGGSVITSTNNNARSKQVTSTAPATRDSQTAYTILTPSHSPKVVASPVSNVPTTNSLTITPATTTANDGPARTSNTGFTTVSVIRRNSSNDNGNTTSKLQMVLNTGTKPHKTGGNNANISDNQIDIPNLPPSVTVHRVTSPATSTTFTSPATVTSEKALDLAVASILEPATDEEPTPSSYS